jgi:putative transposase
MERHTARGGAEGGLWSGGYAGSSPTASSLDGLALETHSLRASEGAGPRGGARGEGGVGGAKKGASEGRIVLKYLDESGFSLCLPPTCTWTRRGQPHQHRVPTRWGSRGRVNLIGTLRVEGSSERLQYGVVEGPCRTGEVVGYLDALAGEAEDSRKEAVVVLDNAPFHTAKAVKERRPVWETKGLRLYYLPAYCPHLNLIEGVWRRVKGFLMPRRFYDSVSELKQAVLHALRLLGAVEVHIQLGDT